MSKLKKLSDVVASIPDGSHLGMGGFAITRCAIAFAHELIRQGKKNMTVSQCIGSMDSDLLVGAGVISKLAYGGGSLDRFGPIFNINRAIEQNLIPVQEYTGLSMSYKYLAGALGIPCIPIQSLLGSDIIKNLMEKTAPEDVQLSECPFTGEKMAIVRALKPDFGVVHAQEADEMGNIHVYGPTWDTEAQLNASEKIIVLAEEMVPTECFQREPENTFLPGYKVDTVIHIPGGAHPTALYRVWDYDAEHITLYVKHAKTPEGFQEYVKKYIRGTSNHDEYIELIGGWKKMNSLRADRVLGY